MTEISMMFQLYHLNDRKWEETMKGSSWLAVFLLRLNRSTCNPKCLTSPLIQGNLNLFSAMKDSFSLRFSSAPTEEL